jgi:anti-anti-sigma factor
MASIPEALSVRAESRNGVGILALAGELDMGSVALLEEHLERFEHDGVRAVMLDLRELSFVDSSGLHAVLRAKKRATTNGHQLLVVGANPTTRRVFELTRTDFLLDDRDAAGVLDRFTKGGSARAGQDRSSDAPA